MGHEDSVFAQTWPTYDEEAMKVVLIRHGKVNFKWRLWYTSEQFNEACRQYNMAPIQQIEYSIPEMVIM